MVMQDQSACPKCGGELKYYDSVPRIVRTKGRETTRVPMRRFRCAQCGAVHRELPELLFPYKQYEAEVVIGVLEGLITCETLGFEDFGNRRSVMYFNGTVDFSGADVLGLDSGTGG